VLPALRLSELSEYSGDSDLGLEFVRGRGRVKRLGSVFKIWL